MNCTAVLALAMSASMLLLPGPSAAAEQAVRRPAGTVPPPPVTGGGPDLPSVIVLPPGAAPEAGPESALASGCWVRFFNDKSFAGRSLTLVGPVEMPKIHVPGGLWIDWGSAVAGPAATVTTYDFEQFKNRTAVMRPGQRVPDLRNNKLGLFEDIHSVKVACGGG